MHRKKIFKIESLPSLLEPLRAEGKKIVLCHGVFDLLHPGHIRHFTEARKLGDILVVTLTKDVLVNKGPGRPVFNEELRMESLASLEAIDFVALNHTATAVEAIRTVRPHFYVKGADYENKEKDVTQGIYQEEAAVHEVQGQIHFTHDITFSSSSILNNYFGVYPEKAHRWLQDYKNKVNAEDILKSLHALKDLKVLLIGDTIIDEYHYCQPLGKSPKETIVSTRYLNEEAFPGGILACANHVASFVNKVDLVTCLGSKDSKKELIKKQLKSNIAPHFFYREDAPTIVKRRYVEPNFLTKMFQVSFLSDCDIDENLSLLVVKYLREQIPNYDLVLVADYGHGFLTKAVRETICEKSKYLALNVQTNSANLGYNLVTKYEKADYVCIDEPELRLAMQSKYAPVQDVIFDLADKFPNARLTITRGHNGSMTYQAKPKSTDFFFEAPSFSTKIVDRVGAGDAYLAVTSLLAAKEEKSEILGFVGNAVGAMAVEVVCNRSSLESVPLNKFVKALLS